MKPIRAAAVPITPSRLGLHSIARASPPRGSYRAIGMGRTNVQVVGAPYEPHRNSSVHAQFNGSYCSRRHW